ncbi:hypothetical protein RUM43_011248 [Polyplax serrata]|uniref:Biogenesis of lysosome-related organelles complex 1 subunit 6 n=1 Tax=Polyplax serrata TaxID=468196 RepID=A0AAN8NLQ8_POLSC
MSTPDEKSKEEDPVEAEKIDNEAVLKLSEGLINIYHPALKSVRSQLLEIVKKQEFLCDEMHQQNQKLSESSQSKELREMFDKIKVYKEKLVNIKRSMMSLHEQSTKLKKRALRLEQQKQKEALNKVHKREYEELLIKKLPNT